MVNIYIEQAVPLLPDGALVLPNSTPFFLSADDRKFALPPGFPFLIDGDTSEVIEPVLLWLLSVHFPRGREKWVKNTAMAHCNDLKDFWQYINAADIAWDAVEEADLADYRDRMQVIISWKTHEPLSDQTIRRRLVHVGAFYDWARKAKFYHGAEFSTREVRRLRRIDDDALAHTRRGKRTILQPAFLPSSRKIDGDQVRPFRRSELRQVFDALGPLPSEREIDGQIVDHRPSRDRLAAELGHKLGLRIDEVAGLEAYKILDLCPPSWEGHDLGPAVVLGLTKTKRLKPRNIELPTQLLRELDLYIRGERAEAVQVAARHGRKRGQVATTLFVNGSRAGPNVGKNITDDTIHDAFHRAVMEAGVIEHVTKTNPGTGEQRLEIEARHSFHDLRHTFAVETYQREKHRGNNEPWKVVQARLGHSSLATTLKYYLKISDVFEAVVSDRMASFGRRLLRDEDPS